MKALSGKIQKKSKKKKVKGGGKPLIKAQSRPKDKKKDGKKSKANRLSSTDNSQSGSQQNLLLTSVFDSIQNSLIVLDPTFRYLAFNAIHKNTIRKIYNIDLKIGFNALELLESDDVQKSHFNMQRAINGETFSVITEYGPTGNERAIYELFYYPIKDPFGSTIAVAMLSTNITDKIISQRNLADAERKFSSIFLESPDAIFVEDENGKILDLNPAAAVMQGIDIDETIGKSIRDLVPAEYYSDIFRTYRDMFNGKYSLIESKVWNSNGEEIDVEISGKKITYGEKAAMLLHVRDIRERKRIETEKKLVEEERARQKEELIKASLQTQLDERNRIAAEMHDELGTGLSKISILGQVVKKSMQENDPISNNIDKIIRASKDVQQGMSEIIWAMDPKNDTLENLIAYINYFSAEFLEASTITCHFQFPEKIPSISISGKHRRNLFLVVKESLNNVIRHSKATHISIKIAIKKNTLTISIQDDGVGFDIDKVSRFKNGINNMKKRIEDAGGALKIISIPGEGTSTVILMKL